MNQTYRPVAVPAERFSRWSLAVFALAAVASIALQNFIFLAIAAWVISMGARRAWKITSTPLNWPLLLLAAALVLSSLLFGRLNPSLFGLRKAGLMAIFFLTAALVQHPLKAERLVNYFLIGATFCAAWSIIMHALGEDGGRVRSFSGDYMAAGGMYMMALVLAMSRFMYQEARPQWTWLACALIIGTALLLTYTRSSWIGAAAALLVLGFLRDWRLPVILVAMAVVALLVFPKNPVSQRVFSLTSKYHSSNVERRYMWVSGLKLIAERPLRGYGIDNLSEVYGRVAHPQALEQRPPHVHNTVMQLAINGGLVAVGAYIWWIVVVLIFGFRAWKRNRARAPARAGTALGLTLAFLAFAVNGLFEFNFGTSQVISIAYFLLGLLPTYATIAPEGPVWTLPENPRLLFLRPRFRGDVLMASSLPQLIRRDYPQARVDLLTEPASVGAAGGNAGWNRVFSLPRQDLWAWWRILRQVRRNDYDVVCDLFGNPRTTIMAFLSGARFRMGPQVTGWGPLFDYRTQPDQPGTRPAWESYFDILRSFGMKQLSLRPRWEVSPEDDRWVRSFLKERGVQPNRLLGIFPGGSHPAKRWPLENFLEVTRKAHRKFGLKSMFVFGPLEKDLKLDYMHQAGKLTLSVEGLPPGRLAALWSHCQLVLSNDAFPMHLGPAVGTPTIGLFGPGNPDVWFAYSPKNGHRAVHIKPDCWPCNQEQCDTMQCWENLKPRMVLDLIAETLQSRGKKLAKQDLAPKKSRARPAARSRAKAGKKGHGR